MDQDLSIMKRSTNLRGWVLITGTSSGIGEAAAELLVSGGWKVIGTVRDPGASGPMKDRLGEDFYPVVLDVTAPREMHDEFAVQVKELLSGDPLLGIVHNAGVAIGGPLAFQPEADFLKMMETNVLGVFRLTQALFSLLGQDSRLIMVSSVSGRLVTPFVGGYAASKFALEALVDAYRHELGMLGMKVVSIQPGPVKTPIWRKARTVGELYAGTAYAPIMSRQDELISSAEANGLEVSQVAETIRLALVVENPKTRYLLVRNTWLVQLAKYLPDRWKDRIIAKRLEKMSKW